MDTDMQQVIQDVLDTKADTVVEAETDIPERDPDRYVYWGASELLQVDSDTPIEESQVEVDSLDAVPDCESVLLVTLWSDEQVIRFQFDEATE